MSAEVFSIIEIVIGAIALILAFAAARSQSLDTDNREVVVGALGMFAFLIQIGGLGYLRDVPALIASCVVGAEWLLVAFVYFRTRDLRYRGTDPVFQFIFIASLVFICWSLIRFAQFSLVLQ